MYDIVIIGKGPAGWSSAITARMRGLSTLIVSPLHQTGWLQTAKQIDNYPGLPNVSGRDLLDIFEKQALEMGVTSQNGLVRQIMKNDDNFMLLIDNDVIMAKTIVFAIGAGKPKLLEGEESLIGSGVSYCATCDGMLYKNKRIAILSANEEGVMESKFLATLTNKLDYYAIKPHEHNLPEGVNFIKEKVLSLQSSENGIQLVTNNGSHEYDGVFIFRSAMPLDQLLSELETKGPFIAVDRGMRTNISGVFAAGDCTGLPLQIAKAVGEGNTAAIHAAEYILKK